MTDRHPIDAAGQYLASAIAAPASYCAAVVALLLKAMVPSVEVGAAVAAMVLLWLIDFALGVMAAKKAGKPITSRRMGDGAWKLCAYLALPATISLVQVVAKGSGEFWIWAKYAVIAFCAGREALSILEKASRLGANLPPGVLALLKGRLDQVGREEFPDQGPVEEKSK
jgi:phage-related holin